MEEIWKDIKGFERLYQVSSEGRVKSLVRFRKGKHGAPTKCKGIILSLQKGKHGYIQVHLSKDHKGYVPLVHRLVGMAFIPNPNNLPCIDHIDGDRTNNNVDNLRWCTTKENMNYDGVRKSISHMQKTSEACKRHQREIQAKCRKPVVMVTPQGEVKEFDSLTAIEKKYGYGHSNIAACCRGKAKTYKKCKFYYKEDYDGLRSKGLAKASV